MSLRQRLELDKDPVFLMDGSAYVFRSFYANQNMTRSDGMPTNVLYMVLRLLFKLMRDETPAHFAFVLDGRGKNFRHRLFEQYKANRTATPEPLVQQLAPLREAIDKMGISCIVSEDCEADDCIASLAARFSKDRPVIIVGADKDLKQCLSPNVYIWDPSGKAEKLISLESFVEEEGFSPEYWPDYQAIVGDSSDNIPGVPGIGAKGAGTLMREFKGLEDIFDRLPAVPPALRKKLEGQKEHAFLSRTLTTLKRDTCIDIELDSIAPQAPKQEELFNFLNEYELRALARELASMLRINNAANPEAAQNGGSALTAGFKKSFTVKPASSNNNANIENNSAAAKNSSASATTATTSGAQGSLFNFDASGMAAAQQLSLFDEAPASTFSVASTPQMQNVSELSQARILTLIPLKDLGGDKNDTRLVIGDGEQEFICSLPFKGDTGPDKPEWQSLTQSGNSPLKLVAGLADILKQRQIVVPGLKQVQELYPELTALPLENCFDLSLAAWLLSPEEYDYSFSKLTRRWGTDALAVLEQTGKSKSATGIALAMHGLMLERLKGQQLYDLMRNIEIPLIGVLFNMQKEGLGMDTAAFKSFLDETQGKLDELTASIYKEAGQEFNIRSARQLGDILYETLGLPKSKKTAGGQASTSQASLEKLAGKHPIIELILQYRKLEKLRSTYLEPLPKLADAQNRIHTSFNQTSTATGRLSSSSPNLQNIPVRGELGGRMRACFTAAPGRVIVSADYSQIELRVLAHLSGDPTLLDAFSKGEDIHRRTAALIYDVAPESVTPDQRRGAKTINFGLVYGMGPQKLAQDLGISMKEAKVFIDRYFERLGKLREYFDAVEASAKEHGYVSTMTGRRRYTPEILSANQQLRSQARRQAINTCIQGSAADIIKLAMLAVAQDEELKKLGATLILQIHDELLLECPEATAAEAGKRMAQIMSGVQPGGVSMSIPLLSEYGAGKSWADAH
ncbi:DNA polymerase I [Desulfovibrio sp. OttesenSCG-928-F07]|nr:DNA polymerase I [Desulfovibrio sp. OttesenSCG-928-F07]